MGRRLNELTEENVVYTSETSGKSYRFNTAEKLNTLLLRMIRKMGLIKVGSHVDFDFDFDHQFIPAHKFDAKYSYKQAESLYPAVCQRASKMGANRKAEYSEPIYK